MNHKVIYSAEEMLEPDVSRRLGGEVVVFSTRCPAKTGHNEDAAGVIAGSPAGGVLVVADGMGGGAAGEQASKIAVTAMERETQRALENGGLLRAAILDGIESANQQILSLGVGAATTVAAVEIQDHVMRPFHVGDSAILVVGQRGKMKLETVAHSPVGQAVELGVLTDDEAMHHEDRHLVSNVLGTNEMRIEIGPTIRLARFDTVLLATDGLFDNLAVAEVVDLIRRGPLRDGIAQTVSLAQQRMGTPTGDHPSKPDDLTIIAYRRRG